jgi:N utilization substance protein A
MLAEVARVLAQEVPEIASGVIQMVAIARRSGAGALVAVRSYDNAVEPIGTIFDRLGPIIDRLGEDVSLALWEPDPAAFARNALGGISIQQVTIDHERHRLALFVHDALLAEQLAQYKLDIELAAELTGWQLDFHELSAYRPTA